MIVDLHTHTSASDGALAPRDLVLAALDEGVELLSITDHDTLAAYEELDPRAEIITGIEISTQWSGRTIHVVGLNVDPSASSLTDAVDELSRARFARAEKIAARLERLGVRVDLADVLARAGGSSVGRPHFAAALVEAGAVRDFQSAFKKYLGAGKPGDVKALWPELEDGVRWIRDAGGTAVIAHPAKYRMTRTKLSCLARDFVSAGGSSIELICGPTSKDAIRHIADLARTLKLSVSLGSDFHAPQPWLRPGVAASLPPGLVPVWDSW